MKTAVMFAAFVSAAMSMVSSPHAMAADPVKVTPETYIRAETDRQFDVIVKMAGGVNRFYHFRSPTPLDKQNVVRMNRDTLYSMGIVDTSKGATITVPEIPKGRYASVFLVDNDHYCPFVIYTPGVHQLPRDTKYLGVGVRIQVFNPKDAEEVAAVNKLQDQFVIKAESADPLPESKWDGASLKTLTEKYEKDSAAYSSWKGMMGPRGKVNEKTRHIAAAAAWGLFPEADATYLNYNGGHDTKVGYKATYKVPENQAFWSITVYGKDGFMKSDNNIVNSSNVKLNPDGTTFTVYFGSKEQCGDLPNRLDVPEGWNFLMRIYRPGKSVLDGSYTLPDATLAKAVPPAEARAIAKEATIYGFPLVDNYRILYSFFVDKASKEYKGPWNQIHNEANVFTAKDRSIQTPNSDTPYSHIGTDLRAEPLVISLPAVDKGRYFTFQLIDLYTHNYAFISSRTTGNEPGSYLLAGPNWKGEKPAGIKAVIRCETEIGYILARTQLFNAADIDNVRKIQAAYQVQPLSAFLGQPAKQAPAIDFLKPLTMEAQRTSLDFFNVLNFCFRFCPTHPSEKELTAKFARIGVGAGKTFDATKLSPEIKQAIEEGMADGWKEFAELKRAQIDTRKIGSADVFGTREYLKNNYLYRMTGAVLGIYGQSKEEAIYPVFAVDGDGDSLDGSKHRYTLRFASGEYPPVNAFWSLTMYELPGSFLYANPLNRYLINSPMLPDLKKDADGGLTLYIQNESPGRDKESNWLPAPKGPCVCYMRLYAPKEDAFNGKWKAPPLKKVK